MVHLEVLTSQYIRLATGANWLLWDRLLCNLLQYLTKLPLFTTKCSFHRRQTVGSLCLLQNGWAKGLCWQRNVVPCVPLTFTTFRWICVDNPANKQPTSEDFTSIQTGIYNDKLINFKIWIHYNKYYIYPHHRLFHCGVCISNDFWAQYNLSLT